MSSREERIGLNEAVFREVNERIGELADTFDLTSESLDLICECGDAECVRPISMSYPEYEQLRSDPHLFAVYPGHDLPDVERVVEKRDRYEIVEKYEGIPKRVAEQTDPRS